MRFSCNERTIEHISLTIGQSGLMAKPNSFCKAVLQCTYNLIERLRTHTKVESSPIKLRLFPFLFWKRRKFSHRMNFRKNKRTFLLPKWRGVKHSLNYFETEKEENLFHCPGYLPGQVCWGVMEWNMFIWSWIPFINVNAIRNSWCSGKFLWLKETLLWV